MEPNEIVELIEAVRGINEQMYEKQVNQDQLYMLSVEIPWNEPIVIWLGVCVYNSEDDDREWIEEHSDSDAVHKWVLIAAHYEKWDEYLRRKMNKVIDEIKQIQL